MASTHANVILAEGAAAIPQALQLPPARDFFTSAGFGGALALLAALVLALIALGGGWRATRHHREDLEERERHHEQLRDEKARAADVAVCEQRFRWVVETAGIEPAASEGATLGLGPEVALELLIGLRHDAEDLGDETLARAIAVYLNQFSLVLAQQGGPLSHFNATTARETGGKAVTPRAGRAAAKTAPRAGASRQVADAKAVSATLEQSPDSASEADPTASTDSAKVTGRRRRQ